MPDGIITRPLQQFLKQMADKMAEWKLLFDDIFVHWSWIWGDNAPRTDLVYKKPLKQPIWLCLNEITPSLYIQG
jgi:hypothetical protein